MADNEDEDLPLPEEPLPDNEYVIGVGNDEIEHPEDEGNQIAQCLAWIGFRTQPQRRAIMDDAFTSWSEIRVLTDKDIESMATAFASRSSSGCRTSPFRQYLL